MGGITPQNEVPVFRRLNKASRHTFCPISHDAAIEPASRTPKKGLAHRRASAGLGRPRREPDPRARRRGGAMAHPALGCMGAAGFGNAGLPP